MSITRNIRIKAETARGGASKAAGRLSGNRRLQAKGRREQFKGNLKQAMAKFRTAFSR
jgi:uncharacterized protein YjbJ (UPF0337 family)